VSEITKSLRGHCRGFGERTTEEMGLQTFPENSQLRRRRDVLRQSVPQAGSGDRKSSSAEGRKTGASMLNVSVLTLCCCSEP